jgi:hypothetical protein
MIRIAAIQVRRSAARKGDAVDLAVRAERQLFPDGTGNAPATTDGATPDDADALVAEDYGQARARPGAGNRERLGLERLAEGVRRPCVGRAGQVGSASRDGIPGRYTGAVFRHGFPWKTLLIVLIVGLTAYF